jgi:segregation and condensation protein A
MSASGEGAASPHEREYIIALPVFEGPLDLLLHLIQKHELDIRDIPVSFVTEKYLEYLALMKNMAIDIASEYLVMAATLVHIKSKSLLPPGAVVQEDETVEGEEGDPREELIRRLLEYQKYKQAAAELNDRGALGRDVFLRGQPSPEAEGPAPLAKVEVWNLLDAFAKVLARSEIDLEHEVSFDRMSITERIQELCDQLAGKSSCRFDELFEGKRTRFDLVITFLAILEMTRLKLTRVRQAGPLEDIYIEAYVSAAEDAPSDAPRDSAHAPLPSVIDEQGGDQHGGDRHRADGDQHGGDRHRADGDGHASGAVAEPDDDAVPPANHLATQQENE